jgi:hypothetical protein
MWKGLLGFWAPKHRRIENYNLDDEACHRFFSRILSALLLSSPLRLNHDCLWMN